MKIIKSLTVLLVLLCTSIFLSNNNIVHAKVVSLSTSLPAAINLLFPDGNLAEVIRVELGKSSTSDQVTQDELDSITILNPYSSSISNISGIEYLQNLQSLNLSGNQISDISPLMHLNSLVELFLASNQISDLSPLSNLTSLETLFVSNNQISNLSPLSNLTSLQTLYLADNQISDLSPIANLNDLQYLHLDYNQISDLSSLTNMTTLNTLTLDSNKVSNLSPLSNLTSLQTLFLASNKISDTSPLSGFPILQSLSLVDNQINDVTPISVLSTLNYLYLDNNQINDISSLTNLQNLEYLSVKNQIIKQKSIPWNNSVVVMNSVIEFNNQLVTPSAISDSGLYTVPNITWHLSSSVSEVSYNFDTLVYSNGNTYAFSGTVIQPLSEEFIVTFMNEKNIYKTSPVVAGTLVPMPDVPSKVGYTFIGWFDAHTGGNEWNFSSNLMPAEDITLFAQYVINPIVDPTESNGTTLPVTGNTTFEWVFLGTIIIFFGANIFYYTFKNCNN